MNKTLVLIGTYNERENLSALVGEILAVGLGLDILVIDDNSPDGTGRIADGLASTHPEVSVLHRPGKLGLGTAYVAGFRDALERGYERVITMDADFSHHPRYLPEFLRALETHDVAVGTRYIAGGGVENWPPHRLALSRGGSLYTRLVTGMPLHDATGGFNGYRREVLEKIGLDSIRSEGYSFMIEMKFRSWKKGFRITEIPIVFVDRTRGKSKMSKRIFLEAVFMVWKIRFGPHSSMKGGDAAPRYTKPLHDLGEAGDGRLRGITSPIYDPAVVGRYLTGQFLDHAPVYAQKFENFDLWKGYLSMAFDREKMPRSARRRLTILDIGSGSGNTIFPLLELCPKSMTVASDLSVPLLVLLKEALIAKGLFNRCLLMQLNAEELEFAPGSFDLVVGGAVLHHLFSPEKTIAGCARVLKRGCRAIFFEPFENGNAILAMAYRELLEDPRNPTLPGEARRFLEDMIQENRVRKGRDKTPPHYAAMDDKWMFTKRYLSEMAERYGFSSMSVFPLHPVEHQFRVKTEVNLRLALGATKEILPPWAWERIDRCDSQFSGDLKQDLLIEGGIVFRK